MRVMDEANKNWKERYSRQILFREIGEEGQKKLLAGKVALIGCGALGSAQADLLVRAGIGRLRIIDRDFVEASNLQRQTLFDEEDARQSLPKAVAAKKKLLAVNPDCQIEDIVGDATPSTIEEWVEGFDVILDGTDNFETRFLINDVAVKRNIPWVYGGAVGSYGATMTIRPGKTACLACVLRERPALGMVETCDTLGVLAVVAQTIAAIQASEAMKLLLGREDALHGQLISVDMWTNQRSAMRMPDRNPECLACGKCQFVYLAGEVQPHVTMCGRDSVQIHERNRRLDLGDLRAKLERLGSVRSNDFLLRCSIPPYELTVFPDGRAIIKGTRDPAVARSLYAKYLGG